MEVQENRLFSRKDIAKIFIPLVLQNLLAITLSMVDSLMVASKGEHAFAGVSMVGSLDTLLVTIFSSLTAGGAVVLSQIMGRGDQKRACEAAKQLTYASTAVAAVITALVVLFRVPLLTLLFGDAEASILQSAMDYFLFLALSFPFLAVENSVYAILRSEGETMISLKISIGMNLLNVAGNAILIYGFDLDAMGAALSTLFSRILGAVILVLIACSKKRYIHFDRLFHFRPDGALLRSILRIGVPNGIENGMFQLGRVLTSSLVSSLGSIAIAANAAVLSLANFQYMAGGAVQATLITVIGRCIGAGEKKQAKFYSWSLLGIGWLLIFVLVGGMCLFAGPLLSLYSLSDETMVMAKDLFLFHGVVSVITWVISFCLPAVFRAASDVRYTMIVAIVSMWLFRVALAYVFALESISFFGLFTIPGLGLGIHGVFYAMAADWLVRAVLFTIRFFRGKWLLKYHGV